MTHPYDYYYDEPFTLGCGCCGRLISGDREWCEDCERHVLKAGQMFDRTFFAQYGRDCPYPRDAEDEL